MPSTLTITVGATLAVARFVPARKTSTGCGFLGTLVETRMTRILFADVRGFFFNDESTLISLLHVSKCNVGRVHDPPPPRMPFIPD